MAWQQVKSDPLIGLFPALLGRMQESAMRRGGPARSANSGEVNMETRLKVC